ncbi:stalk domain-containing protein [Caminicella sporogenes]|uniref:stalk domain-containing protein n=1 Tax=Caminicella sporogenes TaxID=166485 RepID=UPI0025424745|nr:stalk domain-containing protein [Caminicella sporogenes]WIF95036.1 stalk domain-containing protein [Caminicella sporogenes]
MNKQFKGFIMGVVVTVMLMSTIALADGAKQTIEVMFNSINIAVNGKLVKADNILYNGTTYVPLRAVAEMLDKEVGWNKETRTASINDKGMKTKQDDVRYGRNNPAPIGVTQKVTVDDILNHYTAEVTVKEVLRGNDAWELIKKENMFNDKPKAEDEEYILAKIHIKIIDVEDDKKVDVSPVNFKIYSANNVEYDNLVLVSPPEPDLRTSLYAGGEHEGYAVYKVKKSDISPKLVYGQKYDGTGGIWFKLQ